MLVPETTCNNQSNDRVCKAASVGNSEHNCIFCMVYNAMTKQLYNSVARLNQGV